MEPNPFLRIVTMEADSHSLAYVEMWFALGVAFRRFEFELYQTTIRDVLPTRDFFIGITPADSKGVRMKVVRELS